MAQKLVNFGQKIAIATPRVATRWSFQALGKNIFICFGVTGGFTFIFFVSP